MRSGLGWRCACTPPPRSPPDGYGGVRLLAAVEFVRLGGRVWPGRRGGCWLAAAAESGPGFAVGCGWPPLPNPVPGWRRGGWPPLQVRSKVRGGMVGRRWRIRSGVRSGVVARRCRWRIQPELRSGVRLAAAARSALIAVVVCLIATAGLPDLAVMSGRLSRRRWLPSRRVRLVAAESGRLLWRVRLAAAAESVDRCGWVRLVAAVKAVIAAACLVDATADFGRCAVLCRNGVPTILDHGIPATLPLRGFHGLVSG